MSALGGIWNFDAKPGAGDACRRILEAQRVYGPHGTGQWDGGSVAMGRALFEILPEDRYDRQPLTGGDGRFVLIADVRLDNRDELGRELGIDPAEARTLPDAAFILRAWERWGEALFGRLYGDYAFALWDAGAQRLMLARDPLGGRSLHYHQGKDFLAFASMPRGLHALPDIPDAPDEVRIAEMLALLPEAGPRSFYDQISRVELGQFVVVTRDGISTHSHWNPTRETIAPWHGGDPAEALREHLDRAVAARLRGAGEQVAAHLSAGYDSAAVASTAARLLAVEGGRVVAFTSVPRRGFDGPDPAGRIGNEGPLAAATAALYPNMEHVLVPSDGGSVIDDFDRDHALLGRPIFNPSNQRWNNAINAEARSRGIEVMLTGSVGNMTLSYAGWQLLPELVMQGRFLRLLREMRAVARAGHGRWRGLAVRALGPWAPDWAWSITRRLGRGGAQALADYSAINPDRAHELGLDDLARGRSLDLTYRPRKEAFESRIWALQRHDLGNYQKWAIGGWGIDTRDPTSDRRLAEFCLSLPTEAFLANGIPRALARRALADRLPAAVLDERRKGYQAADWHEGLTAARPGLLEEIARLEQIPDAARALDLPRMRALIEDWPADGWDKPQRIRAYRLLLARGIASGHFIRRTRRSNV